MYILTQHGAESEAQCFELFVDGLNTNCHDVDFGEGHSESQQYNDGDVPRTKLATVVAQTRNHAWEGDVSESAMGDGRWGRGGSQWRRVL